MTHSQCLTFTLHHPDYWLAYHLASYGSHLMHPGHPFVGTGPFRLTLFTPKLVRIKSHDHYHLNYPPLKATEYWITPQLFSQSLDTNYRHPVQITIDEPRELSVLNQVSSGISLGFCYLMLRKSTCLSTQRVRRLINIIHCSSLLQALEVDENLITPSNALLPGWTIPQQDELDEVVLLERLTLAYYLPVELRATAEQLRQALALLGCELTLISYNAKNWDGVHPLAQADLMMDNKLIGGTPEYTLEQWLRCDQLWSHVLNASACTHLQTTLNAP